MMLLPTSYSLGTPHSPSQGEGALSPFPPYLPLQLPAQETCSQSRVTLLVRLKFSLTFGQAGLAGGRTSWQVSSQMNQLVPLSDWMAVVSSHGSETTPLFNTQLITSHCLLQPKGEVSLAFPHPNSSLLCSKPQSHPCPSFQHWHSNLSASWFSSHRSQEAIPAPPHPERWFNSKSASSEIWERVGMWSQEGGESLPFGDQWCQLSIPKPFLHTDRRPSATHRMMGKG